MSTKHQLVRPVASHAALPRQRVDMGDEGNHLIVDKIMEVRVAGDPIVKDVIIKPQGDNGYEVTAVVSSGVAYAFTAADINPLTIKGEVSRSGEDWTT
jgi:hypothetical protein